MGLPVIVPRSMSTVLLSTFASAVRPARWTPTAVGLGAAPSVAAGITSAARARIADGNGGGLGVGFASAAS